MDCAIREPDRPRRVVEGERGLTPEMLDPRAGSFVGDAAGRLLMEAARDLGRAAGERQPGTVSTGRERVTRALV
jgi:hypothetical protein